MYVELHCKTNFSFLQGASHPDELVTRAAQLGYTALAITDRNTLAGVVRAHLAAKQTGLPLLIGAEITPVDAPPCLLWVSDRTSYAALCRLITHGRRRTEKGRCHLTLEDISRHSSSLLAGVIPYWNGPCQDAVADSSPPLPSLPLTSPHHLSAYHDIFADRCYLLAELHHGVNDPAQVDALTDLSRQAQLPLVAAGNVHYHVASRIALHDVLTAISQGVTVAEIGVRRFPNAQRHLRTLDRIRSTYGSLPGSLQRTLEITHRCTFSLEELRYEYPKELAPGNLTPITYLQKLAWQGAQQRYPRKIPVKVRQLLQHELQLIEELHYEAYFLTVWDLVRFARSQNILCQGRGSAANSAVCYCLGITAVDPDTTDVLFERFISRERNEAPDIDVDFEHERREEVLQYLYHKYGRDRAGMTAVVTTYRSRSAIRDVGKALGLSPDRVDSITKNIDGYARHAPLEDICQEADILPGSAVGKRLIALVNTLVGFPRHLSQHVGGMVMTRGPLCELVPIENASMDDRTVIQWNKDDLKVDCLSLGMLTAIHKCFRLIKQHHNKTLNLANIPAGDEPVYDMICRADTVGVFQIESRAQMSMLPRLRPRNYYDLVIEVAIVRPGPIQGQMVHPYLRRRSGIEKVTYPNSQIRNVLKKTLGVPLFQEQAMRLAVVAAGFTPGEADQLRRAMGAWRRPGLIDQFRQKLIEGMRQNNLSEKFSRQVFEQIRGFGEYGFPESHAASFALLVYVSAWLKHYYPAT
ncbi:MAG TPA: DNA polymerase III subunit alpha [Planctomycetaceae bacterium]|nr:DNA polymerase III subunit alpha [Planctomycetaceae bacterium]